MLNGAITTNDKGEKFLVAFIPGASEPLLAHESHPNFSRITAQFLAGDSEGFADLFDIPKAIERGFQRLSERVTVKGDSILFDGDEVHGTIVDAILSMLDAGEDFEPLVKFYEKLTTNPLGDVRQGLYDWIAGQKANGNFTITDEGNVLGYKSVRSASPTWRTDQSVVYRPSRAGEGIVNGRDVASNEYIEQVPGDVVEMPRSRVLHAPSRECADGLHIGTWNYADSFSGDTVMLVEFNPRDIVSVPDNNSSWKLRVCRYTVIGPVTEPLDAPVYHTSDPEPDDLSDDRYDLDVSVEGLQIGDRVRDPDGDEGEVVYDFGTGVFEVEYDNEDFENFEWDEDDLTPLTESGETATGRGSDGRLHGKGGPTSQAAKGRGKNPAQDSLGRFSAGRPGSQRDSKTGRFA